MNKIQAFLSKHKTSSVLAIVSILIWCITFITDRKVFTSDPLDMNCLPIDYAMVPFMHVLSKLLLLFVIFGLLQFVRAMFLHKKTLLVPFIILMLIYIVGLVISYPGYFMSDDPIIFAYASRYYPVYWHNYLTSLYYMIAMSLIPASCGPVLLNDICYCMVYSYIFYEVWQLHSGEKRYASILLGILPFSLLGGLMCFRPALYAPFFLHYIAYLYFEHRKHNTLTLPKIIFLGIYTALLSIWRSEAFVLLVFVYFIVYFAYKNADTAPSKKQLLFLFLAVMISFTAIKTPQTVGEKKYYGKDYLIISTTRPLTVIIYRNQTYPGAEEDLQNVDAITDYGYLHNDSLSCSAYNRYNSDNNQGKYTETGADIETQNRYLKSAFRLILHNLDLYFGERIQLFLVTNGFFNYDSTIVMSLKPVVTTDFPLYDHDRAYGFELIEGNKRIPLSGTDNYAHFLYKYGGEAYIPMLLLLGILTCLTFIKKRYMMFFMCLMMLAREAVIFLTAPASFIQYSYPVMFATAFLFLMTLLDATFLSKQNRIQKPDLTADAN